VELCFTISVYFIVAVLIEFEKLVIWWEKKENELERKFIIINCDLIKMN